MSGLPNHWHGGAANSSPTPAMVKGLCIPQKAQNFDLSRGKRNTTSNCKSLQFSTQRPGLSPLPCTSGVDRNPLKTFELARKKRGDKKREFGTPRAYYICLGERNISQCLRDYWVAMADFCVTGESFVGGKAIKATPHVEPNLMLLGPVMRRHPGLKGSRVQDFLINRAQRSFCWQEGPAYWDCAERRRICGTKKIEGTTSTQEFLKSEGLLTQIGTRTRLGDDLAQKFWINVNALSGSQKQAVALR